MLVTGPMVAALWIVAAITNHLGLTFPPPLDWAEPGGPVDGVVCTTARIAVYGTCVAIALLAVAAFYTVLTTGRLSGWLSSPVRIDVAAAAIASAAAILADCGILTALGMRLVSGFGLLAPLPVAAAVLASCARIVLTARAGRHFAGRRSALG